MLCSSVGGNRVRVSTELLYGMATQNVEHKMAEFEGILGCHFQSSNIRGQI